MNVFCVTATLAFPVPAMAMFVLFQIPELEGRVGGLLAAALLLTVAWLGLALANARRAYREVRDEHGGTPDARCATCGYFLGLPSNICPECGTRFESAG